MIIRTWGAVTSPDKEPDYLRTVKRLVLPHLRKVPGYRGPFFVRRQSEGSWRYLVLTCWESMDAVRALAGSESRRAFVPAEIRATLDECDETAEHFEVVIQDLPPSQ